MPSALRATDPNAVVVGWDFSTGAVKALAFDLSGTVLAEVRLPSDRWVVKDGVRELSIQQLEGQARASVRAMAAQLHALGRLPDWHAGGLSATHHTAGRIDAHGNQVRRMVMWDDPTLATYHAVGLARLGGQAKAIELTGGPWAARYSLSHLVKDEATLSEPDWHRTRWIQQHGCLAAGYLTGRFDCISVSSAASTGMLDLRTEQWRPEMLEALEKPEYRSLAAKCLPTVLDMNEPVGPLAQHVVLDAHLPAGVRPLVFPTLDDQAAGLVGGGATDPGHVAVILGTSAVVNSSSGSLPKSGNLDCMKLNWGAYLWMRCYSNGAQFFDHVVGENPDWDKLEAAARAVRPGCGGTSVLPFLNPEPSRGVTARRLGWSPAEPTDLGARARAAFEAVAYLIGLAVKEHEAAGQAITRITVSGGMAKSDLMCEILASVLNRPLDRLVSKEGSALGAAVAALAGLETTNRRRAGIPEPYTVADAVAALVKFRDPVKPQAEWVAGYRKGLEDFGDGLK